MNPKLRLSKNNSTSEPGKDRPFNPASLTEEKDLWDIWVQIRHIKESKFNVSSTWLIVFLNVLYAVYTPESTHVLADKVRSWSDLGLNFGASLLGFLIAGFTIFATLVKPELFLQMAQHIDKKTGLSYLKGSFFRFIKIFTVILFFIFTCYLVKAFALPSGLLSIFVNRVLIDPGECKRYLAQIGIVFVSSVFFYMVVLVQSFIFNVYHSIMTSLRWEAEYPTPPK
ncbi:hypothetical protein [Capsulimonas corticalis]|uniref:hypothetical protein n=1 Tax=Capsulimonas corticalis TaxID=2219043 RepID=UPI000F64A183|nr:hypothetical protein [Capsulimonas corticalis]